MRKNQVIPPQTTAASVASFLASLHTFHSTSAEHSYESDALLAHIRQETSLGHNVRSTDLVRAGRFGTLQTLNPRLHKLVQLGLLLQVVGEDRRAKHLVPTKAADALFEQRANLLAKAGFENPRH